mmetsp:Transcript_1199/g.1798  ORF Transcript_1199/g.1798 Transcript_1199/m.1798 type:complete len:85 (-) Transcript_1199:1092-1346(-)
MTNCSRGDLVVFLSLKEREGNRDSRLGYEMETNNYFTLLYTIFAAFPLLSNRTLYFISKENIISSIRPSKCSTTLSDILTFSGA